MKNGLAFALPFILVACNDMDPEQRRRAMHLPPVGFKGYAEQGRALFNQYCAACHGQGDLEPNKAHRWSIKPIDRLITRI